MRILPVLSCLLLSVACQHAPAPTPSGPTGPSADPHGQPGPGAGALPVVGHGQVCYARDGRDDGTPVATCAEGLACCYPCGIDGCDSVCHTPAECDADAERP